MEFLLELWLPILVGTVVLWIMSAIAWVALPHHFGDFKKVDAEDEIMDAIRKANVSPGNYMLPQCNSKKEQNSKEYMEKYMTGPRVTMNVYEVPNMGVNMALTIVYFLVTVVTIAYITHVVFENTDPDFMRVFRVAGTIGVLTYATSNVLHRIWFKAKQITDMIDGFAYGIVLGLIFAALWPYAS